jgi:glyoxylase-like metal-dependent hydrolase (beta-lactamase superfamily II)
VVDMTSFLFETCGLILTGDVTFQRPLSRWHII